MMKPFLLIAALMLSSAIILAEEKKKLTEDEKIESLIKHVENLKDAKFVRNGTEHDPSEAAQLMRYKWDNNKDEIKTAKHFITICATKSSTSGQPYLVRFKDGKEQKSADYLTTELEKLEKPADPPRK
jgi:hypothetical protein